MAEVQQKFDAPIPGMSLTAEVGARPWQSPPKYSTIEEALTHYIPRITSSEMYEELLDIMELGIPLTSLADMIQSGGVMEGLHSIDVGVLITPVIMETLALMGDEADIEYELGMENRIDEDKIPDSKIAVAIKKMRDKMPEAIDAAKENVDEVPMETEAEELAPEPTGLMARRL